MHLSIDAPVSTGACTAVELKFQIGSHTHGWTTNIIYGSAQCSYFRHFGVKPREKLLASPVLTSRMLISATIGVAHTV